jgi:hypothetical protein
MIRSLETRIAKLEEFRKPRVGYVVRVSDPTTGGENEEIKAACREGRPIAVLPRECASIDEWAARYAHGRLQ